MHDGMCMAMAMCMNGTEENKNGSKGIKIKQRKRFQKQ